MSDNLSIRQAEAYLQQFQNLVTETAYAYGEFSNRLKFYQENPDAGTRVDLQSSIAHFEKYIRPFVLAQQVEETPLIEDADTIDIGIDGSWGAYEFRQFFDGVDYLHKLYAIQGKLRRDSPDLRLRRGMTRSPVYSRSRLYYYLSPREELHVRQIQFASPGLVSFEGVGDVIGQVRGLINDIITLKWIKGIIDTIDDIRFERQARIAEARQRQAEARLRQIESESKLKVAIQRLQDREGQLTLGRLEDRRRVLSELNQIADLMIELENKGLASLPVMEDNLLRSMSLVHRLGYEQGKIRIGKPQSR